MFVLGPRANQETKTKPSWKSVKLSRGKFWLYADLLAAWRELDRTQSDEPIQECMYTKVSDGGPMPAVNYAACQTAAWNRTGGPALQAPKQTGVHQSATREFNLYNYVGGMPTSLEGMPRNTVSVNQWANLCRLGSCGAYQRRGYIVQPMSYSTTLPQEVDRARQSPSNSDDESDDRDAPD